MHLLYDMFGSQEARLMIPEEVVANGFQQMCVKAGDILIVPEALTQCVSSTWKP